MLPRISLRIYLCSFKGLYLQDELMVIEHGEDLTNIAKQPSKKSRSLLSYMRELVSLIPHPYPPHSFFVDHSSTYLFLWNSYIFYNFWEKKNFKNKNKKLEKTP